MPFLGVALRGIHKTDRYERFRNFARKGSASATAGSIIECRIIAWPTGFSILQHQPNCVSERFNGRLDKGNMLLGVSPLFFPSKFVRLSELEITLDDFSGS